MTQSQAAVKWCVESRPLRAVFVYSRIGHRSWCMWGTRLLSVVVFRNNIYMYMSDRNNFFFPDVNVQHILWKINNETAGLRLIVKSKKV